MRQLEHDRRLLRLLMHELLRLEQEVVIKAVAATLEEPPIGCEYQDLLARAVLLCLPKGLELVLGFLCAILVPVALRLLLLVLLELHVGEGLRQVEMDLIDVLDGVRVLDVLVLGVQLVHGVKDQVEQAAVVGSVDGRASCGGGSRWRIHESLHHSVDQPLPVGGDGNQSEVVGELDEAFHHLRSEYVVILIGVVPGADSTVQIHDKDRVAPPILREGALPREVQPCAPCKLGLALLIAPSGEEMPAVSRQFVLSLELDVLVAETVVVSCDPEAYLELLH